MVLTLGMDAGGNNVVRRKFIEHWDEKFKRHVQKIDKMFAKMMKEIADKLDLLVTLRTEGETDIKPDNGQQQQKTIVKKQR